MTRKLVLISGIFLFMAIFLGGSAASTTPAKIPATDMAAHGIWMSLAPPRVDPEEFAPERLYEIDEDGAPGFIPPSWAQVWARKHHLGPNPRAAKALAHAEARAIQKNKNPAAEKRGVEYAKLLVLLIEFDDTVVDTFVNWERPTDIFDPTCVVETVDFSGPMHGLLPDPATVGTGRDNNTFWVPDFNVEHYEKLLFSEEGITERVRTDLTGPDGQPGIDISGYTLRNYFLENSSGMYDLTGTVVDWLTLPHSEAWYGADSCAGGAASMIGHPDNPIGAQQSVIDAVDALNAREPDFPWDEFDTDDDGVVDHLVFAHAGVGEEGGGGPEGTYSIWSHSSDVMPAAGGYVACTAGTPGCDPDHDIRVINYIMQPEDAGVGVFAHEYGHDLGLPDLYDVVGSGGSDVAFWALMNTGSHSGPIFQAIPSNLGLWSKWVLGWADPVIMDNEDKPRTIKIGQTSNPPLGSADGIKINLPDQVATLSVPHSGENMWWSNNDSNWADYRLGRDFDLTGAVAPIFTFWTDYTIEVYWDYAFVEVSTDGGMTWVQLPDMDGITTNFDPFGRLVDYGGLQNGITGDSGGWIQMRFDLAAYAGESIKLRFRYATDAGFLERGMFVDDIAIDAIGFFDDAESGPGEWVSDPQAFVGTPGAGWIMTTGTFTFPHYYMVEWRSLEGFDEGLKYAYDSTFLRYDTGEWLVERVPYNAPGMLVWYRNTRYAINDVGNHLFDPPSPGAKGTLLLVDAHFEPLRRIPGTGGCVLCNMLTRPQSSNAAFNTWGTYPFQEGYEEVDGTIVLSPVDAQPAVDTFTDTLGWVPGVELRLPYLYWRDFDASVVVPSHEGTPYTWRVVWPDGSPATDFYGLVIAGYELGSGNPADSGVEIGTYVEIQNVANDDSWATVHLWNSRTTPRNR
ncbi:MAG: M6 family metalloprotease domain-containing protein [Anaerolineales bacterium]|nr:M6 family metalloprotease domain-containing protein [Anaerolineales bacterium]